MRKADYFQMMEVEVTIRGYHGEPIEDGLAEVESDKRDWRYRAKGEVPFGRMVSVTAVAKDIFAGFPVDWCL